MKAPFLRTYVGLAVLAGLFGYIYFVESKKEEKPEKAKEKAIVFDKTKAKEVTLASPGGETIQLEKDGGSWKMVSPLAVPAQKTEVELLLSDLENVEVEEVVAPSASNLGDYGLEHPKLTVGVLLEGATEPLKILLGDKAPTGASVYAKLPSQPRVFAIASYVESSLNKKPFDFRDRDLLHVKREAVRSLGVTGPEGPFTIAKNERGEFALKEPLSTRAGRWSVDALLGMLEALRMDSVAAEDAKDLKPFGLAKPARTIKISLAEGGTKTLEIGGSPEAKKYYAREGTSSLVGVIPSGIADELAKGMGEFRAKRLLDLSLYDLEGFDVTMEGKAQAYSRSSQKAKDGVDTHKWRRTSPDPKDVETTKVEDVLVKLGGIDVAEFLDHPGPSGTFGFEAPILKIELRSSATKQPNWVEIGEKNGVTYARRVGDDAVLKLDTSKVNEVVKGFKAL
jgi:hypothetical protein